MFQDAVLGEKGLSVTQSRVSVKDKVEAGRSYGTAGTVAADSIRG